MKLELDDSNNVISARLSYSDEDHVDLPSVSSKKLVAALKADRKPKMGILPPAVRWLSEDLSTVVFERPPMLQTIGYAAAKADRVKEDTKITYFNLPIPWTVYVVQFSSAFYPVAIRVFARNEPLGSIEDRLGVLPLPNFYFNSELCMPSSAKAEAHEASLSAGVQLAYNMVWNSGFNTDLMDAVRLGKDHSAPVTSYERGKWSYFFSSWEKINFQQVLETKWPTPFGDRMGARSSPDPCNLKYILNLIQVEDRVLPMPDGTRFMVHLVNLMSSTEPN